MTYLANDTDWKLSTKGNWWRRANGTGLTVGQHRYGGGYWVSIGGHVLKGRAYSSLKTAQMIAEIHSRTVSTVGLSTLDLDAALGRAT